MVDLGTIRPRPAFVTGPDRSAARSGTTQGAVFRQGLRAARERAQTASTDGLLLVRQPAHREVLAWLAVDVEALAVVPDGPVGAVLARTAGARAAAVLADLGQVLTVPGEWPSTGDVLGALGAGLTLDLEAVKIADPWLRPLAADLLPELTAVQNLLAKLVPSTSAAQASARGLALRVGVLQVAGSLLDAGVIQAADGDLRDGLVAQLWIRRHVLHDSADGEGHKGFAHVVDGEAL